MSQIFRTIFFTGYILVATVFVTHDTEALASEVEPEFVTVLVTGANRGLGLEFARQYAARGYRVIATARRPDSAEALRTLADDYSLLSIERLDVT